MRKDDEEVKEEKEGEIQESGGDREGEEEEEEEEKEKLHIWEIPGPGPRPPGRSLPCTTVPPPPGAAPGEAPGRPRPCTSVPSLPGGRPGRLHIPRPQPQRGPRSPKTAQKRSNKASDGLQTTSEVSKTP